MKDYEVIVSSRPEPTRISCHVLMTYPRVRFSVGENRMKSANATKPYRRSGGAQRSDLRFAFMEKRNSR